jgi:hypothetical protein
MAANWLDSLATEPEAIEPQVWNFTRVSTKPGSIRGGASETNQNPTSAVRFVAISTDRIDRYRSG